MTIIPMPRPEIVVRTSIVRPRLARTSRRYSQPVEIVYDRSGAFLRAEVCIPGRFSADPVTRIPLTGDELEAAGRWGSRVAAHPSQHGALVGRDGGEGVTYTIRHGFVAHAEDLTRLDPEDLGEDLLYASGS